MILETSAEIDKITEALAKAQGEMEPLKTNATNPHFNSDYADLGEVRARSRTPLSTHGIALVQAPSAVDGRVTVVTLLSHVSGQWMKNTLSVRMDKDTPQGMASATTYGKRIGQQAMLGLAETVDDDGNEAEDQHRSASQPPKAKAPETPMLFSIMDENHISLLRKFLTTTTSNMPEETIIEVANLLDGKVFTKTNISAAIEEAK